MRAMMEQVADRSVASYRTRPGFQSVMYLADDSTNAYGSYSVWATRAGAEAAAAEALPRLAAAAEGHIQTGPASQIWEIYEPGG